MPRPVYVLCARGISEDKISGLMTVFSILETIDITPHKPDQSNLIDNRTLQLFVLAVWMKDDADGGIDFEHQWILHSGTAHDLATGTSFQFEQEKPLFRFTLIVQGLKLPDENGLIEFESRVRRAGFEEWISQRYPIVFQNKMPADALPENLIIGTD